MSDIDLTAVAEAVARAQYPTCWEGFSAMQKSTVLNNRREDLRAALPLIEAAVREKVAAEIEADREEVKRRHGSDPEDLYVRGRLYGSSVAAGIAKNGPRL